MKIDYESLKNEVLEFLDQHKILVFATCAANRVTARAMSCVYQGLTIYFQTGTTSVKFKQLTQNPNVALCAANVQIEGVARIRKHPLDSSNIAFIEAYQTQHLGSFQTYSHLKSNVVIEVEPRLITFWKYDADHKPYRDLLYVDEQRAEREYYDLSD